MKLAGVLILCNTLQRTATHCNTPQHTATHDAQSRKAYGGVLIEHADLEIQEDTPQI